MHATALHKPRRPNPSELADIPWLAPLTAAERERAAADLRISAVPAGERVCRIGQPATHWMGLVDGLLKMSADIANGQPITYSGLSPGGWFGEGTLMKGEAYRYDIQALRTSQLAALPAATFHWLLDHSIGFNRFVMGQLNERLGQFILAIEAHRSPTPEERVARHLATLVNPVLFPRVGEVLRITQQELAYLAGLSRQRVNEALSALSAQAAIRVEYGGLRILDAQALRTGSFSRAPRS